MPENGVAMRFQCAQKGRAGELVKKSVKKLEGSGTKGTGGRMRLRYTSHLTPSVGVNIAVLPVLMLVRRSAATSGFTFSIASNA